LNQLGSIQNGITSSTSQDGSRAAYTYNLTQMLKLAGVAQFYPDVLPLQLTTWSGMLMIWGYSALNKPAEALDVTVSPWHRQMYFKLRLSGSQWLIDTSPLLL